MTKLLLDLRHVPDDEADEVRELLEEHEIAFYETKPSRWGISGGAIWISHREDVAKAEGLMAEYQVRRRAAALAEYRAARDAGAIKTVWDSVRDDPLRAIAVLIGIVFFAAILIVPFLTLGD